MSQLEKDLNAAIQSPEMQAWLLRTAAERQRLCAAELRGLKRRAAAAEKVRKYLESRKAAKGGK